MWYLANLDKASASKYNQDKMDSHSRPIQFKYESTSLVHAVAQHQLTSGTGEIPLLFSKNPSGSFSEKKVLPLVQSAGIT